jgi:tetratricopeptide (TPR) repeat protein
MRDASSGDRVYEEERARLAAAIDGIPRMRAWLWERDAPVGDYSSEAVCVHVAGTSDCLVLAIGHELTATTRKEYEAAHAAKAHCFIFQDARVTPDDTVRAFIKAERSRAVTGRFSGAEDLARQAVDHLTGRAVYSLRQAILSRRRPAEGGVPPVEDRTAPWSQPPPPRRYEEQEVAVGASSGGTDNLRTVAALVAEQRERAEHGEPEVAFAELNELAFSLYEGGRGDLALEVLDDLRSIVPPGLMSPSEDAWVLNTQALALSQIGKDSDADDLWRRMLALGARLDDTLMRATAMQNLGISAINRDEMSQAKELVRDSMKLMQGLEEWRSMLQLLNSLVLIAIDEGDHELAAEELDFYEEWARKTADWGLRTSAHGNRGRLLVAQGRFDLAEREYREALRCARHTGEPVKELLGLQNLGAVCADQERFGDAMRWYRKGVRVAESYGLHVHAEVLRRSLATVLHRAGRNREAIGEFDRARHVAWQLGDQHQWAQSTMNMGATYVLSGDPHSSIEPLENAVSMFRKLGDLDWELQTRRNIAGARRELGELEGALDVLERGQDLLPADAHEERGALLRQAAEWCLENPGLRPRAIGLFERGLDEEAAYLEPKELARRAASVGAFLSQAGSEEPALSFFDRCIADLEDGDSAELGLADALNDRAVALGSLERHDEARADLVRCVQLAGEQGRDALSQKALANLSEVERQRGDVPASLAAAQQALRLAREMDDKDALAHAIGNLGLALEDDDRPEEADEALQELQELADAREVPDWQARAASGFGRVAFLRGEFEAAAEHYRSAVLIYRETESDRVVFPLGGLLESLSKAGQEDGVQETAQALVDRVLAGEQPELVISYLGRSAISWLERGALEAASSLLGIAVRVAAQQLGGPGADEDDFENEVQRLAHAVGYVALAAQGSTEVDEDTVCDAVVSYLEAHEAGAGEAVTPFLQMMRDVMREHSASEQPGGRRASPIDEPTDPHMTRVDPA